MSCFSDRLKDIRDAYRARDDWDCVPEISDRLGTLTGSAEWNIADFDDGVFLYGAGSIGSGAAEFFARKRVKVLGFLDDTPGREGTSHCGLDVMPFASAGPINRPIFISMKNWQGPAARLSEAGVPFESFAHYIVRANLDRLHSLVEKLLSDPRSKSVCVAILKANMLSDFSLYPVIYDSDQYFAVREFQYLTNADGVMVDAGAYVGQIMEELVHRSHGVFKRIHAFEPNPKLHSALRSRASRLRQEWALPEDAIACVQAGLGESDSDLPFFESGVFNMTGGSFLFSQGNRGGTLPIKKLDNYLGGSPLTYLKADVEGFEIPLLRGAAESIRRYRPKLALSIYHRMTDLIDVPLFVQSLVPEYKMALRHHSLSQEDSVLYCW